MHPVNAILILETGVPLKLPEQFIWQLSAAIVPWGIHSRWPISVDRWILILLRIACLNSLGRGGPFLACLQGSKEQR